MVTTALEQRQERFDLLVSNLEDSMAVLALVDLGVFNLLYKDAHSAQGLAHETQTDAFRLSRFLNLAAGLGFIRKQGDLYALYEEDKPLFDPHDRFSKGHRLSGFKRRLQNYGQAIEVLKSGVPLEVAGSGGDVSEKERRAFLTFLHNASVSSAQEVAHWTTLFPVSQALDVGAGAGTYLWEVLKKHPNAKGTWVDRENAIPLGEETARAEGVVERVNFLGGDFFEDDLGNGYDFVMLSNLVHCFDIPTNQKLISKLVDTMPTGGHMLVKDLDVDDDRTGPLKSLRFGVTMALVGNDGDTFSENDVKEMVAPSGLRHKLTFRMKSSPHSYGMLFEKG